MSPGQLGSFITEIKHDLTNRGSSNMNKRNDIFWERASPVNSYCGKCHITKATDRNCYHFQTAALNLKSSAHSKLQCALTRASKT
ncbi:hypothetical protein JZ751_002075 [Albula glossodonta]|uniref:Uncharacterized protein n=1 Tax=Albula glossodonta TaxID=121402 RepID=A0A8T2P8V1_9TELE|nr:hypothetical protein JZ751_002075 [Albula glossodonta]